MSFINHFPYLITISFYHKMRQNHWNERKYFQFFFATLKLNIVPSFIKMSQKILEKYLWINNSFFENALRRKSDDDSLFLKTFDVTNEITKRNQSYWCDIIKFELNYTDSGNDLKCSLMIYFKDECDLSLFLQITECDFKDWISQCIHGREHGKV